MDVSITISGINASPFLISYEREDKICTGIGQIRILLSLTCYDSVFNNTTISPNSDVALSENGSVVKQYNIINIEKSVDAHTVQIMAQDGSKKLQEYFITSDNTTTLATYTKTWITKFLDEALVTYTFTDAGSGNLLPNETKLGMMTAYDQILYLLQLSGWYMYFDSDNTCIIGKLSKDLSDVAGSFDKSDVLTIHTHKDDSSLRNRAVVWGMGDPATNQWVFADVSVTTRWNYDKDDKRTIVLSSPYIPNFSSAYSIAYKFIDEYARLTFTKEATLDGAREVVIGDTILLDTDIFCGAGLVTTVGVEMTKDGLITKVILDERCPRLLGYYNFGGYVYAGTWGAGVKRKHLDILPSWESYSSGLTDLYVNDLYMNNGILSCVTQSGNAFVSKEIEGYWTELTIPDTLTDDPTTVFARAVTQDKLTNNIHLLVDSAEGMNASDFYTRTTYSGGGNIWVLDITPDDVLVGTYPITLSGITISGNGYALDIDNDGYVDYVSIAVANNAMEHTELGYNFGSKTTHSWGSFHAMSEDFPYLPDVFIANPDGKFVTAFNSYDTFESYGDSFEWSAYCAIIAIYDNESIGERMYVYEDNYSSTAHHHYKRYDMVEEWDEVREEYVLSRDAYISDAFVPPTETHPEAKAIVSRGSGIFDFYYYTQTLGVDNTQIIKNTWDSNTNIITPSVIGTVDLLVEDDWYSLDIIDTLYTGNTLYILVGSYQDTGGDVASFLDLGIIVTNTDTDSVTYYYLGRWESSETPVGAIDPYCTYNGGTIHLFQYGDTIQILGAFQEHYTLLDGLEIRNKSYIARGTGISLPVFTELTSLNEGATTTLFNWSPTGIQLNSTTALMYIGGYYLEDNVATGVSFACTFTLDTYIKHPDCSTVDYDNGEYAYLLPHNIFPITNENSTEFIAKTADHDFYPVNILDRTKGTLFSPPDGYELMMPFSTPDTYTGDIYWQVHKLGPPPEGNFYAIARYTGNDFSIVIIKPEHMHTAYSTRGFICGGFIVNNYSEELTQGVYLKNIKDLPSGITYLTLERSGETYSVIHSGTGPQRLDCSSSYPLVSVQDALQTINLIDTVDFTVWLENDIISSETVGDFRYCNTASGTDGMSKTLYMTISGELWSLDISDITGDITIDDCAVIYSGNGETLGAVETSNYISEFQYLFVATSGESPHFFQQDDLPFREESTNLGSAPVTIVRLDDRI